MPELHCPGRSSANTFLTIIEMECSNCGRTIEIFGDEVKVLCRCGQYVFRGPLPSCSQWCKEAARCFGHVGEFPKALPDNCMPADLRRQEERFREIQAKIVTAVAKCPHPETRDRKVS